MRRAGLVTLSGLLLTATALGTPAAASGLSPAGAAASADAPSSAGGPPTVTGADLRFTDPSTTLRPGTAREAGLVEEFVDRIVPAAAAYMEPGGPSGENPSYPGFALLAARDGVVVADDAQGYAVRYASWDDENGTAVELPQDQWVPMQRDTIFDMASITKLFTSVVVVQMAERGELQLDAPVAEYLPEFAHTDPDKADIVVQQLLTHTSGMTAWLNLYSLPDDEARMQAIYSEPLRRTPGSGYEYSDLNLITLGKVVERITDDPLDEAVAERITEPLGMTDTMFNPPESLLHRIAATEYQPWTDRGLIRGTVHDENAWSFGGVAGHAGIFSTVSDLAVFGQMILNGGRYGDARILSEDSVRAMLTNLNAGLGGSAARGLGWQLDQRWYMDAMTSPVTTGHTGYTGTSLVVDPLSDSVLVLHTNRVHPTRNWGTVSSYRRAPARELARAVPVDPAVGRDAWFSGQQDAATVTLTAPLTSAAHGGRLTFHLWYDTEATDVGRLLASTDDGASWEPVPMELRTQDHRWSSDGTFSGFAGRQWLTAHATLPDGTTHVRWSYASDSIYQGRGVYVDGVRVVDRSGVRFNGERPADAQRFVADGWTQASD
ncbi:serine hydrolase domain-containing protein [Phytoactinopolyspora halotolerans]|uniref:Serine hydrolase n=1 Tax=Phytoactinopolyspora halotolerans TaxID=1981512 RepID=A0A6L9SD04_9ACTN|nr:serine hydrolase domain-containing protein [Phytoactinopolyspora halotolerans]NEE03245.1 serine hydrolase [Phytoactinopolyspora halotolerans]